MIRRTHAGRRVRGFTLIELLITLMVAAIGVALAVPTFRDINQRRQTTAKAEELATFLNYARSEAIKANAEISVSLVHNSDNDWCVGAVDGRAGCDCETADSCVVDGVELVLGSSTMPKSSMTNHTADTTFVFDPVRGTKQDALGDLVDHSYEISSDNTHWALQVSIGPTGRVRVCNPADATEVPGFQDCATVSVPPIIPIP